MNEETDQILESLRPRMRAARVSHVRRLFASVAVVPLLGFGAVAMAADGDGHAETVTAYQPDAAPEVTLPDIGSADGVQADRRDATPAIAETTTTTTSTTTSAPDGPEIVELGLAGAAEVVHTDAGIEVLSYTMAKGWTVFAVEEVDGHINVIVTNGETMKLVTIQPGARGDLSVAIEPFELVTTTTTVRPEPKPAPITDRIIVEVPGKGSFVVEREGHTLWAGNVTPVDGYTYDIIKAQGWKVYVGFSNGSHIWYGKAFLNDAGRIEQLFWDEPIVAVAEPVYQWVEIPGIGAARFKVWDGQIYVKELAPAAGYASWDYNQGTPALTARVDFEGNGQIWFIDTWIDDAGALAWTTSPGP